MEEEKKPFEEPSCTLLSLNEVELVTTSGWYTSRFDIEKLQ